MIKAVHASNIPSDLPRSPLQPGLSGDLARDRDAFAAFWSQCDELRLRFPPKPSRTAAEATACAAILAAERRSVVLDGSDGQLPARRRRGQAGSKSSASNS
ncbi:MAG: hypothetical protein ABW206_10705, partial [Agrobacterium vaccinii]